MYGVNFMYINNKQNKNNPDNILEQFKKGEITIHQTFKLITRDNKITNPSIKEKNKINSEQVLTELEQLVGLKEVKELIKDYIAFLKIQKLRSNFNLKSQSVVMHMVFKGNPGTGKTTVARIIGKIFNALGFLDNGQLIEVERADLVGEYIGHTAQKTKKKIQKAKGGVLFIDEAYSLARGGRKDFGKESIDTLVKAMEDYKDNLIIILAGYRDEMNDFLKTNPGLKSRFAIHLDFPDYSIDQLVDIAKLMFKKREYILTKVSKHYIYNVLSSLHSKEGINKGNARTVRNLVERAIRNHARRIVDKNAISRQELMTIKNEDLARGFKSDRLSGCR